MLVNDAVDAWSLLEEPRFASVGESLHKDAPLLPAVEIEREPCFSHIIGDDLIVDRMDLGMMRQTYADDILRTKLIVTLDKGTPLRLQSSVSPGAEP